MLATLLLIAQVTQKTGDVDVAPYLSAHREADRALTAGKSAEARAGFEKCLELAPKNATVAYGLACTRAKAGEKDAALGWLTRAVEWGYADAELALWDSDLASLRDDERFKSAIELMRALSERTTGDALAYFSDRSAIYPVNVSVDGAATRIAVGYSNGELAVLDARSGEQIARVKDVGDSVWDVAIQRDGRQVVALTSDGNVHFWRPDDSARPSNTGTPPIGVRHGGFQFAAKVEFDPSGERVLVASSTAGASLWTKTGALLCKLDIGSDDYFVLPTAWNSDGSRLAHWQGSTVEFIDGKTGERVPERLSTPSRVWCVAFDPKGTLIATGHEDGRVRFWNPATLSLVRESEPFLDEWTAEVLYINCAAFSTNGERLAFGTGTAVNIAVIETATLRSLSRSGHLGGRMGEPFSICWAPDSTRLWSAYISGGPLEQIQLTPGAATETQIAWSRTPTASQSGVAAFAGDSTVTALDTVSGRILWTRMDLTNQGVLFHTCGGWFDANLDALENTEIRRRKDTDKVAALSAFAIQLFDPKRVRAAKAGVALAPVKW